MTDNIIVIHQHMNAIIINEKLLAIIRKQEDEVKKRLEKAEKQLKNDRNS